jgi:formylglycine-generating enzyme required for sulfatase activity
MRNTGSFLKPHAIFIMVSALIFVITTSNTRFAIAATATDSKDFVSTAATGEKIPNPASKATYGVKDGASTVQVPLGMAYVPAGSFIMGNGARTENAVHTVKLSAYCIGKYQVTNAEWKVFCDETGNNYRPRSWGSTDAAITDFLARRGNHPVLGISYANAVAYCDWISKKTGWTVKVPSEAQWERAARGATTSGDQNIYPWGNELAYDDYKTHTTYIMTSAVKYGKPLKEVTYGNTVYDLYWPFVVDKKSFEVINQKDLSGRTDNKTTTDIDESSAEVQAVWRGINAEGGGTTPVGSHSPSPAGCYDMAGNAFELTRDWFTVSYYLELAKEMTDPVVEDESVLTNEDKVGGSDGDQRRTGTGTATKIVRGGSWYAHKSSGLTYRRWETRRANDGTPTVGFRIAIENIKP